MLRNIHCVSMHYVDLMKLCNVYRISIDAMFSVILWCSSVQANYNWKKYMKKTKSKVQVK